MSNSVYILSATGGLEDPSFKSYTNENEALDAFRRWSKLTLRDVGEHVHLHRVDDDGDLFLLAHAEMTDDGVPTYEDLGEDK